MNTIRKAILGSVAALALISGASVAYADSVVTHEAESTVVKRTFVPSKSPDAVDANVVRIYDTDRAVLNRYTEEVYTRTCGEGISNNTKCKPQREVVKRYEIGHPLSEQITYEVVPQDIVTQLRPVPTGYRYVQVDNDVLLMNEADRNVIDSVTYVIHR